MHHHFQMDSLQTIIKLVTPNCFMVVHPEKFSLISSQVLVNLGFIIDPLTMTIQLTTEKALGLKTVCVEFLQATTLSITNKGSSKCDWKDSG